MGCVRVSSKKYAIVLWDHGSGLNGFGKDLIFTNDILNLVELKIALLTAKIYTNTTFELIGFDACLILSHAASLGRMTLATALAI